MLFIRDYVAAVCGAAQARALAKAPPTQRGGGLGGGGLLEEGLHERELLSVARLELLDRPAQFHDLLQLGDLWLELRPIACCLRVNGRKLSLSPLASSPCAVRRDLVFDGRNAGH